MKKSLFTRICMLMLVACMVLTTSGCSGGAGNSAKKSGGKDGSNVNASGFPITNEKITLKGIGIFYTGQAKWSEMPMFQELEKKTNIHIEWENPVQGKDANDRINALFASGELPDFIMKGGPSIDNIVKWGRSGSLVDLKPLIDQYAPNVKEALEKYPSAKTTNITPEGKIYSLPTIYDYGPSRAWRYMQINQRWLKNVGKEVPKTLDEFVDVLTAFRDKDANGNGDTKDEIPYSAHTFENTMRGLLPAFGIDYMNGYPAKLDGDKVKLMATSDEFKAVLQFMNKLYTQKLLDPGIFTQTQANFQGNLPDDKYGVVLLQQTLNAGKIAPDLIGMEPLIGDAGADARVWNFYNSEVSSPIAFYMTSKDKYPEATMRWIDYFYAEGGANLVYLGTEGDTCVKNADGTYSYTDKIAKDPKGFAAAMGKYSIMWGGGAEPGLYNKEQLEPGMKLGPVPEFYKKVEPFLSKLSCVPIPILTAADHEKYTRIIDELGPYFTEMKAKFVSGSVGFDKWDEYTKQMEKLGSTQLEQYMQTFYDKSGK